MDEFLNALYGEASGLLTIWTLPDKRTRWIDVSDLTAVRGDFSGMDVYFGVGLAKERSPGRTTNDSVSCIPGLWVDIDIAAPGAHATEKLPGNCDEALALIGEFPLPPSALVDSGHGIHAYWLFREPWEFDTADERASAADLLRRLQIFIRKAAAGHGWTLDATHDLARIMRLPGTMNNKSEPVPVRVLEINDNRYNQDDFDGLLPDAAPVTDASRNEKFDRRPTDGPAEHVINNCAFIQHCRDNAADLSEPHWVAMLSNIARCADGPTVCHELSCGYPGYSAAETDKKITHVLNNMHPQSCEYIRGVLGFDGCTECSVTAPCGWALATMPKAVATIRGVAAQTDAVFQPAVIGALALIEDKDPAEYARFKDRVKGKISIRDLAKAIKKHKTPLKLADGKPTTASNGLVIPPNWIVNNTGILLQDFRGDEPRYFRASYHPVMITRQVKNVDTDVEKLQLEWRGRKILAPRSVVMDSRKIMQLADRGLDVSSESARWLVKYLFEFYGLNQDTIPNARAVARMGWRGRDVFFPGCEGDYELDVDDDGVASTLAGYKTAGEFDEWLRIASEARKTPTARFILATAFGGPLLHVLGQRTSIIHNWGASTDGKTAALFLALSVWGDPDKLRLSFDSTKTGLERVANNYTGLIMGVNERETVRDKGGDIMTSLLYMLAEGKGRQRGTKTGVQQSSNWLLYVLTNGEDSVAADAATTGAITRVLEIYGGPFPGRQEFSQNIYHAVAGNHGWAGPAFVRRVIAEDWAHIRDTFASIRSRLRAEFPNNLDAHIDTVSVISTADFYASQWIFGADDVQSGVDALEMSRSILAGLVTKNDASDVNRAWDFLVDWIESNASKFKTGSPVSYGFKDCQCVCVYPTIFKDALKERGFSPTKLLKEMEGQGRVVTAREGGKNVYQVKRTNPNETASRPRVIAIPLEVL